MWRHSISTNNSLVARSSSRNSQNVCSEKLVWQLNFFVAILYFNDVNCWWRKSISTKLLLVAPNCYHNTGTKQQVVATESWRNTTFTVVIAYCHVKKIKQKNTGNKNTCIELKYSQPYVQIIILIANIDQMKLKYIVGILLYVM